MLYEKNFMKEKGKNKHTVTQKQTPKYTRHYEGKKIIDIFIQNQSFHFLLNSEKKKSLMINHFQ